MVTSACVFVCLCMCVSANVCYVSACVWVCGYMHDNKIILRVCMCMSVFECVSMCMVSVYMCVSVIMLV